MTHEASKSISSVAQAYCSAEHVVAAQIADLRHLLSENIVQIEFTKADGSNRIMNATLRTDMIVPYERKTNREKVKNPSNVAVWDIDADSWRSVNVERITRVQVQ